MLLSDAKWLDLEHILFRFIFSYVIRNYEFRISYVMFYVILTYKFNKVLASVILFDYLRIFIKLIMAFMQFT